MGTQREVQIGYGRDISSILHLGAARRASLATSLALLSDCLPFSSPLTLGQTSDPKRWLFGHLDKAALKKKTLVCFTLKPSSSEGLEKTASLAFMCDRCPGDGGGCNRLSVH